MAENKKKSDNKETIDENQQPKRCFVMMPFSDPEGYDKGHFRKIYEQIIKPAIEKAGYTPDRVDENGVSDLITTKIFQSILDCEMAICDLSSRNPNVLYELGIRHAFDKPVVLIKDNKTDPIFDIQGISTVEYRRERLYDEVIEDQKKISEAIKANKNNSSGYSILNMVNLQKATYDANTKDADSLEFNKALLMRVLNALEMSEKNQADVYSKLRNEKEQHGQINYDTDVIDARIDELESIIKHAYNTDIRINTTSICVEINEMLNINSYYLNSSFTNIKRREYLYRQKNRLKVLLDNIYELENHYYELASKLNRS